MTSRLTGCVLTNCRHFMTITAKNHNMQCCLHRITRSKMRWLLRASTESRSEQVQYSTKSKVQHLSRVCGPALWSDNSVNKLNSNISPPASLVGMETIIRNYKSSSKKKSDEIMDTIKQAEPKLSLWARMKTKLGMSNLSINKSILKRSGSKMYIVLLLMIDYPYMVKELKMPDTYMSFFYIIELHLWLLMMRLMREGEEGKVVRNACIESMWSDLDRRVRAEVDSAVVRKEGFETFQQHFITSLCGYDEGYLSDDPMLAGALWRSMYMHDIDPCVLELLVSYVRKQVKHLDSLDSKALLYEGFFSLLPLHGDDVDEKRVDYILNRVYHMKL